METPDRELDLPEEEIRPEPEFERDHSVVDDFRKSVTDELIKTIPDIVGSLR